MDYVSALAIAAMLGAGAIGGVFLAFSSFVMPALARIPTAQGVAAMQSINVVVINASFLGVFLGTGVLCLAALAIVVLHPALPGSALRVAGAVLYLAGTVLVTGRGNVPLNNSLAKLAPDSPEAEAEWRRYVLLWTAWNHARTVAALAAALAFGLSLLA